MDLRGTESHELKSTTAPGNHGSQQSEEILLGHVAKNMTSEQGYASCEGPSQAPSGPVGKLSRDPGCVMMATCSGDSNEQQALGHISVRVNRIYRWVEFEKRES